jgi:hypothetical protein
MASVSQDDCRACHQRLTGGREPLSGGICDGDRGVRQEDIGRGVFLDAIRPPLGVVASARAYLSGVNLRSRARERRGSCVNTFCWTWSDTVAVTPCSVMAFALPGASSRASPALGPASGPPG